MSEAMGFLEWMLYIKNIYYADKEKMSKALEKIEIRDNVNRTSIQCIGASS